MKKLVWNIEFSEFEQLPLVKRLHDYCVSGSEAISIAFVNPHTQVAARKNKKLLRKLNSFNYVICDGVGTQLASRLYKNYAIERLSGPKFFQLMSEYDHKSKNKLKYFFLGSTPEVLSKIEQNMAKQYPHIEFVGSYSPPMGGFTDEDNKEMLAAINSSGCTVLWVGLTAPKQEQWIAQHLSSIEAKLAAGIGAEFDYFAGMKTRPPKWISDFGLQWLHRLITQPNVWNRTLISAPVFVFHVIRHRFTYSGE